MDVAFAGASALEIVRLVRRNPNLNLTAVDHMDLMPFEGPRGSASKLSFCALGLSSPPTRDHPAFIRVPNANRRKRVGNVRCLVFPRALPPHALLQLQRTPLQGPGAPHVASQELFDNRRVFVDSVPLACATIAAQYLRLIRASKMTEADAVVQLVELIMEFCGTYGRDPFDPASGDIVENIPPLSSTDEFREFIEESSHVLGIGLLSKALLYARDGSKSAMETCLWIMMTLPEKYGFYAFRGAKLNIALTPSEDQRALMQHSTLTPDLSWESSGVAVEYQGYETHSSKSSHAEDARRMNDYQVCGITALFVTFNDVRTVWAFDRLAR